MKFSSYKKIVILLLIILLIPFSNFYVVNAEEGEEDISQVVERIFKDRSLAILNRDLELIEQFMIQILSMEDGHMNIRKRN